MDFYGNGDTGEGVDAEIKALHGLLLEAIKGYARQVASSEIAYHDHAYPYFFVDSDGSGAIEDGEAKFPNLYQAWTPRHLKVAYNYQFVAKDRGALSIRWQWRRRSGSPAPCCGSMACFLRCMRRVLPIPWGNAIHVATGFLIGSFLISHLYLITTGETVTTQLRAMMITGWDRHGEPDKD